MAQLTLTQRAEMAANTAFQSKVRSWLKNRANFWKDTVTTERSEVNRAMQKRKRFAKQILLTNGFVNSILYGMSEYFLMQYNADPPVLDGGVLADSEFDNAAFNAAYDYFAGVEAGDDTDLEIDW